MLNGMVIPTDMVKEDEESTEGASSDGYRKPSPGIMVAPAIIPPPPPSEGKARKKRKTREPFYKGYAFYKGYGVVYLPGDMKGLR